MTKKTKAPSDSGDVILALPPERAKRLESDNLRVLLDEFGNDDLDPIVRTLNEATAIFPGTRLKDTPAFGRYAPDHRCYRKEIAADLCRWGSHEIISAVQGETSSYRQIVYDLCKRAKVETDDDMPVFEMERRLLQKTYQASWDGMSADEKAKAAAAVGGAGLLGAGLMAVEFAGLRLAGVLGGPIVMGVAGLWTAWDWLGPGYRVTMPCVLSIADTRFRLWRAAIADSLEC
jgi:uncharacterized protein YaaW (UPF0174 family)